MQTTPASPCPFPNAAHIAGAIRLSTVKPQKTRWLWPGKIPLGRVTLLASDPGLGKSLLTLDIAARVSRGAAWPDQEHRAGSMEQGTCSSTSDAHVQCPKHKPHQTMATPAPASGPHAPCSVLLLTSEDDLADTIRPRLEALGADLDKILAISNIPGENAEDVPRAFALNRDLARLNNLLNAIPDCRLLIIDPISAYLGSTSENANADVRSLLAALAEIARERNLAVVIVSHLRKKEGAAIYRTIGSLAFTAAARAVWTIRIDPDDPTKRLLLPIKTNLASAATGLAFHIESTAANKNVPTIRWSQDPVATPDLVLADASRSRGRPDQDVQYAMAWLKEQLAEDPRPARRVRQDADAYGITYGSLRRAFRNLKGEAFRADPPISTWYWKLETTAQKYEGEFSAVELLLRELAEPFRFQKPKPANLPSDGLVASATSSPPRTRTKVASPHSALPTPHCPHPTPPAPNSSIIQELRPSDLRPLTSDLPHLAPCPPASTSTTPPPAGRSPTPSTKPSTTTSAKSAPPTAAAATAKPASPTASSNAPARASPS